MNSHNNGQNMGTDREYKEGTDNTNPGQERNPSRVPGEDEKSGDDTLGRNHNEKGSSDERRDQGYAS